MISVQVEPFCLDLRQSCGKLALWGLRVYESRTNLLPVTIKKIEYRKTPTVSFVSFWCRRSGRLLTPGPVGQGCWRVGGTDTESRHDYRCLIKPRSTRLVYLSHLHRSFISYGSYWTQREESRLRMSTYLLTYIYREIHIFHRSYNYPMRTSLSHVIKIFWLKRSECIIFLGFDHTFY